MISLFLKSVQYFVDQWSPPSFIFRVFLLKRRAQTENSLPFPLSPWQSLEQSLNLGSINVSHNVNPKTPNSAFPQSSFFLLLSPPTKPMNVLKKSRTFFLYPSPSAALQQSPYHKKRERERNGSAESGPANSSSSKDHQMGYLLLTVLGMIMVDRCKPFVAEGAQWQPATAIYSRERNGSAINEGEWKSATATYTKETNGPIINEGACGYGDLHRASYGVYSAGLSTMLFNRGSTCGACFELRCVDHIRWCLPGSPTVILTATDFCPPNYGLSADYGGWCNFPQEHFEMSEAAFAEIAERAADIVPVQYRRVKCGRSGGLRFTIAGNSHYYQVLVTNVGSDGEVMAVKVKGSKTGWIPMARNWGQNWQCNVNLKGQPLSFEVTTSDKMTLTAYNVAPANWQFGQTFEGKQF